MKFLSLLAGLGVCMGAANIANAEIIQGTASGYFAKVYATDLTGAALKQYDNACKSKHWMLVNTQFFADYRVNTDAKSYNTYFTYANFEHQLTGAVNAEGAVVFTTDKLAPSLTDLSAKKLTFTIDRDFWQASASLVFAPTEVEVKTAPSCSPGCDCDCGKDKEKATTVTYQCVVSTY